jgi:hypothetical protein
MHHLSLGKIADPPITMAGLRQTADNVLIPHRRSGVPGSFMIHADSKEKAKEGKASTGCIALPDQTARQKLAECPGGTIEVTP